MLLVQLHEWVQQVAATGRGGCGCVEGCVGGGVTARTHAWTDAVGAGQAR